MNSSSAKSLQYARELAAFVVRVRGDGRRYEFTARTEAGFGTPIYRCAFTTKRGEWEEHRLPFRGFSLLVGGRNSIVVEVRLGSGSTVSHLRRFLPPAKAMRSDGNRKRLP